MHPPDQAPTAFGVLLCCLWLSFLIGWLVVRSRIVSDAVQWFRRQMASVRVLAIVVFLAVVAVGGNKGGGNGSYQIPRPSVNSPRSSFQIPSSCTN